MYFSALRPFLRWAQNPVANLKAPWSLPSGNPSHRRWLTKEVISRLFNASRGRERLLVALEGFNGLRRVEVLRLRFRDIHLDAGMLRVLGKGRDGGKWRQIPISPVVKGILGESPVSVSGDDRVIPLSSSGADLLLQRAASRAGLGTRPPEVSHHDLRRTFGRLAHQAGMDLVQLKNLYGHASMDQTVHYIGLDEIQMRDGLNRLEASIRPLLENNRVKANRRRVGAGARRQYEPIRWSA